MWAMITNPHLPPERLTHLIVGRLLVHHDDLAGQGMLDQLAVASFLKSTLEGKVKPFTPVIVILEGAGCDAGHKNPLPLVTQLHGGDVLDQDDPPRLQWRVVRDACDEASLGILQRVLMAELGQPHSIAAGNSEFGGESTYAGHDLAPLGSSEPVPPMHALYS